MLSAKLLQSCPAFCDPGTVACQAPWSMGFSRQEYWCGLPCPPPGDLPNPVIEPESPVSPALAGRFFTTGATQVVDQHKNISLIFLNLFLFLFLYFFNFYFYYILLYNTVLVLPYIDMNPPRVYMSSQSWTPFPLLPHIISLGHPSTPVPSILYPVSNLDWQFVSKKEKEKKRKKTKYNVGVNEDKVF